MTGVENAGVENWAPSSEAYSVFQVREREVRASGYGSPLGESCRDKAPLGSLGDGLKKFEAFEHQYIHKSFIKTMIERIEFTLRETQMCMKLTSFLYLVQLFYMGHSLGFTLVLFFF